MKKNKSTSIEYKASIEKLYADMNMDVEKYQSAIEDIKNALIAVKRAKENKPFILKWMDKFKSSKGFRSK